MRTYIAALTTFALKSVSAQTFIFEDCKKNKVFNALFGGADNCHHHARVAWDQEGYFISGGCAKDRCYIFHPKADWCNHMGGCVDLINNWACGTKQQCDKAKADALSLENFADELKCIAAGQTGCSFIVANDTDKREGWVCCGDS